MIASEVRCPECGKGFMDVAPDFDVTPRLDDSVVRMSLVKTYGHCEGGHLLTVSAALGEVKVTASKERVI